MGESKFFTYIIIVSLIADFNVKKLAHKLGLLSVYIDFYQGLNQLLCSLESCRPNWKIFGSHFFALISCYFSMSGQKQLRVLNESHFGKRQRMSDMAFPNNPHSSPP